MMWWFPIGHFSRRCSTVLSQCPSISSSGQFEMPYWMVHIAPLHKPGVVISGGSIDNIGIHIVMGRKLLSLVYDGLHMIPPMSLIEGVVSGNNLRFDILS